MTRNKKPPKSFAKVECHRKELKNKRKRRLNRKRRHKLLQLQEDLITFNQKIIDNFNRKALVNLTSLKIPKNVQFILSLGPKFNMPTFKRDDFIDETICATNELIDEMKNVSHDPMKTHELLNHIHNFIFELECNAKRQVFNRHKNLLLGCFEETKRFLKKHKDIVITNADKGQATVILSKDMYDSKLNALINDGLRDGTYEEIESRTDLHNEFIKNRERIAKIVQSDVFMSKKTKENVRKIISNNEIVWPRFYITIKAHKIGFPPRPIVSAINSPTSRLQSFLLPLLQILVDKDMNMKDSFKIKSKIAKLLIPFTHVVKTFDVKDMFTNIPIDIAMQIIRSKFCKIAMHTDISCDTFVELIKYALMNANSFTVQGKIYRQMFGLAMGGILSAVISDIVLDHFLKMLIPNYDITFFNKFMDDIICIISKEELELFHLSLNDIHPRLRFVSEQANAEDGTAYLDMKIFNVQGRIFTSWYQKEACSGRLLSYLSDHSKATKLNLVKQFIARVMSLTDAPFRNEIEEKIRNNLQINHYPRKLINDLLTEHT